MQTPRLCCGILRTAASVGFSRAWPRRNKVLANRVLCSKGTVVMEGKKGKKKAKSTRSLESAVSYLQVLGNGTDTGDTCPSVLLFFDQQRFVFNVGEGFQRYCFQHRIKLGKAKHFFLTRMSTEAGGGVPGLVLTLTEHGIGGLCSGTGGIVLHAPQNTNKFVDALETFVSLKGKEMVVSNFGNQEGDQQGHFLEPLVDDANVKIHPMFLLPEKGSDEDRVKSESEGEEEEEEEEGGVSDGMRKRAKVEGSSQSKDARDVVAACYLCHLAASKGKFHPEKAKALGIKPGPAYAELQSGQSVMNSEGVMVHSHQVMDNATPAPKVIIVDCPNDNYVEPLCTSPGFTPWIDTELGSTEALLMVHLGPAEVVSSNSYLHWISRLPKKTRHIFVNLEACQSSAILRRSAVVQTKLNFVDEQIFPLPAVVASNHANEARSWDREGFIRGKDLLKYWLKPPARRGVDESEVLEPFSVTSVQNELEAECLDAIAAIKSYKDAIRTQQGSADTPQRIAADELEITFLGTGSAVPSKYRNVTCIYLDFFKNGSMLLDCGEGSYGQLIRRYGLEGAEDALRRLKCVWISHIHADHHAGLPRLLSVRQKLLGDAATPVLVMGPHSLRRTLLNYSKLERLAYKYLITSSVATMDYNGGPLNVDTENVGSKRKSGVPQDCLDALHVAKEALGLNALDSFYVKHCSNAFGVKLESKNWKVVFSGDSMPCNSIVKAAKDATVLIHEATFEEDMIEEAISKKHSTTKDALAAAAKAKAYCTLLTHFSQRYPKIPVLAESTEEALRVGVAFDLMSVNLANLDRFPLVLKPCMHLFHKEANEADVNDEELVLSEAA